MDSPAKIKRVCLDISDSMAYVYWNTVNDACASFTKYEIYGREDQFSVFSLLKTEANIATNNTSIKLPNRKRWEFFILVSNSCNGMNQFSSDTIFLDNQEPTQWEFDSISVDCVTQKVVAGWTKHSIADVEGYYIYNVSGGSNSLISTETELVFNGINEDPTQGSITHLISAFDSCKNASPLSKPSSTIFLTQSMDTCLNTLYFNWSHYVGWSTIGSYKLMVSTNLGPFIESGVVTGASNTINYKYTPGENICAFIRAVNGNNNTITSSSNKVCKNTNPLVKPNYLYINKVTIEKHDSLRVYSIQDETNIDSMVLERKDKSGPWLVVDEIKPVLATYKYTDQNALVNSEEYEYRLIAYNSCKQTLDTSNTSKNILLTLTNLDELIWNNYSEFDAGVDKYNMYRSVDGSTWNIINTTANDAVATNYTIIPASTTTPEGEAYCFCVMGVENGLNSFGRMDTSVSNKVCATGDFAFFVPNAFKPEGVNRTFKPFTQNLEDRGYNLQVANRWGEIIFSTTDPGIGWDGSFNNQPCQMGAYVYIVSALGKDGTTVNSSGIINLIR